MKSFLRSFSYFPLICSRRVVVSYKQKYVLTACSSLVAQEINVVR